jgi:hypothetical protein
MGERGHPGVGPGSSSIGGNTASEGATQLNFINITNIYVLKERLEGWSSSLSAASRDEALAPERE